MPRTRRAALLVAFSVMIVGMGTDVVEVERVRGSIERFGRRFLQRVFTPAEIAYCETKANAAERFAARFAAKEAALKAIGTGLSHGISWREVEIQRQPHGAPLMVYSGKAFEFFERMGARQAHVSITHTASVAFAVVILES